ncbi:MAG: alanine--tRNA ligase [Candidatus Zambryskibacteria bacterium RIFCSPLOWO2_01_FULL_39_39]|uniref:Alanine--tRNA ligase n=1 Tax=Candidatus Zambryskibacteria bacterium RIFCSPLOWO2_01_FULL_39_39 TaxID=1802758 RepID=A0A1G2TX51_9BACT|nr:MAG: Alanine-tRNA ligase [Parcubacteria group bacterium GW2011_GWA1_38_7]OHA87851.1 MAG: alanine--tRNA ligase [Candidatus Zambryskibacteria bacterium RIFCSPHIGHO2_01_FULL_39_63]OHA94925.1 MAG: alanine--tRNA ligase [Candidatus Zambryskibacteria bacterium RIFCSPHIGHO2_02_FULL_39_19]OHA99105.1 MAG: alanine--tRNA ligase [Candidatus Zambryskibacteria bacterium RIFCSPHIGHO2_12_FULL_39_21]OHB01867.1 MAG: alanine--tRNA ligase [Candidatus Zambryskibacteria bacterium RIFCSPLOWO2_01_FULL_39_39]
MTSEEIRKKYLEFFEGKGHKIIPSASLVPENDPTVLFTTAGMHPLVPYLLGEKHPLGVRLVDVQKCIRTGDIEEVGDSFHHTFFEMLGNWSLGDYFKKEAIEWSYEFLTDQKWLGLDKDRLAVSVFAGDSDAPFDNEAYETWKSLSIPEKRIAKLPKKNNWWGPAGETGPCGGDTEMFYWTHSTSSGQAGEEVPESFNDDNSKWLEIWNDVFMQYNKTTEGKFALLTQQNVDTGMGLERTLTVMNGLDDNYKTDLFWPIIEKMEKLSDKKYEGENIKAMRIIADHLKAATFILGDEKGITPSNTGQGYVLRRLIRRAVRYGKQIGLKSFTKEIAEVVIGIYKDVYSELSKNKDFIFANLSQEEEKFEKTLENGLKEFEKRYSIRDAYTRIISGLNAFWFFSSFGLPKEVFLDILKEKQNSEEYFKTHLKISDQFNQEYDEELKKHQELSRTSSAGMFKGGLSDAGEETKKLHTATHLLRQALENVLGEKVMQRGSNITAERLRFDFNHDSKLTAEEKQKVEDLVNQKIAENLPVNKVIMKKIDAEKTGAVHAFGDKYGDEVSVYFIGPSLEEAYSKEFCGGPHIQNTSELGTFKIVKEEAVSAGIRRIKAILE